MGFFDVMEWLPSGKRLHNYGKSPFSSWVNPLFLWPFSIAGGASHCWVGPSPGRPGSITTEDHRDRRPGAPAFGRLGGTCQWQPGNAESKKDGELASKSVVNLWLIYG